jgi:hypothetical protein
MTRALAANARKIGRARCPALPPPSSP